MSVEIPNRRRYRKSGICYFAQIPMVDEDVLFHCILHDVGGISGWRMYLKNVTTENGSSIYPYIRCINNNHKLKFGLRYLMNVINHRNPELKIVNEGKCYHTVGDSINGQSMLLSEILNEENGWLKDGELWIEFGINVESIQGDDEIWKFNFCERIFHTGQEDYLQQMYTFERESENQYLECREELINFASPDFDENMRKLGSETVDFEFLEMCLQIVNGVQLELDDWELEQTISLAYSLNFPNVIRYCERQMIEHYIISQDSFYFVKEMIFALKYNLNYYLTCLLKNAKSSEKLAIILHEVDFQMMSSETMKTCAKYFFDKKKEKSLKKMRRILRKSDVDYMSSEAMKCMMAKLVYDEF